MKQALEALEDAVDHLPKPNSTECGYAITSLRQAIAEASENGLYREGYRNGYGFGEAAGKRQAIAEAEKQEPVEYQIKILGERWTHCAKHIYDPSNPNTRALYTHPQPKREPLTNDNPLLVFAKECVLGAYSEDELADAAFKAIAAAHGIKE